MHETTVKKLTLTFGVLAIVTGMAIGLLFLNNQGLLAVVDPNAADPASKITICHFPPGNPDNPQTIEIDESAWETHQAHGDYLGECVAPTPTETPSVSPTPTISPSPTATVSPTPTLKPTKTPSPAKTPTPAETPTPTPTAMPAETATATATPEPKREVNVIAPKPAENVTLGDTIYYTFEVVNNSEIEDDYRLTLELTPREAAQGQNAVNIGKIPAEIHLAPGQKANIATYLELPLQGRFTSLTLTLTAQSLADEAIQDEDAVVTSLEASAPSVEFSKTADKRVLVPGETVEYTLNYRNTGNIPLLEVVIEDTLPEQAQFQSSSIPPTSLENGVVRFELHPVLLQGQGGDLTITARVREDIEPRGDIVNRAELSAKGLPEPVEARAGASIEVPDLSLTKTANQDSVEVGDIVLYTVTVTNNGSGAAQSVRVLDDLPSVLRYTAGSSVLNGERIADPQAQGSGRLVWEIGELRSGDHITLHYQATVASGAKSGRYYNAALVSAKDTGGRDITSKPVKLLLTVRQRGAKGLADIEGLVFWDKNGNKTHDADEPGLPDIQVILVRDLQKQTSAQDGAFFFADVKPGEQLVAVDEQTLPQGFKLTTDASVLLTLAERDRGYVEFGVQTDWAELTGVAFYDLNQNGQFDANEPGLQGMTLAFDEQTDMETDRTGAARATRLAPGAHSVMIQEASLPPQFVLTTSAFFLAQLPPNASVTKYFGVKLTPGAIRAVVFEDANENGQRDEGEPGVANAVVRLTNGKTFDMPTNADGQADFGKHAPAAYSAHLLPESLPAGLRPTTGLRQAIMLAPGEEKAIAWPLIRVAETPEPEPAQVTPTPTPTVTPTITPTATPTPTVAPETPDFCEYTVKSGDTLSKIAAKFTGKSANYKQIKAFNHLEKDALRIGAALQIPTELLLEEYRNCRFEPGVASSPTPTLPSEQSVVMHGMVFFDKNHDGQYDENDLALAEFHAILDGEVLTRGEKGIYTFSQIEPGTHHLEIMYQHKNFFKTVKLLPGVNQVHVPLPYSGITVTIMKSGREL